MDPDSWTPVVREYFEAVGRKFAKAREAPNFPGPPPCDLSNAIMPIGMDTACPLHLSNLNLL